jgi:uncharacterized protein (TIGR03067 family)
MRRITCVIVVLACPLPLAADADDSKKDLKALRGKWKMVGGEAAGKAFAEGGVPDFSMAVADGGKATGKIPSGDFTFTITVDPKKSPKAMDNLHESGEQKGKRQYGIYKLDGDKLTVCMSPRGAAEADRPKEFTSKGGKNVVFVFERAEDDAKAEMAKVEGEWSMVSGVSNGYPLPEEAVKTGKRVAKGGETTIHLMGRLYFKAKVTIDPAKTPKTIDYAMTEGPTKGKTQLGIYEVDGDTVKFCFGAPGKGRPEKFTAEEGSGRTLSVWKRVKK